MGALLGGLPGEQRAKNEAQQIASLPMQMGGLGLRSARRMAHGAYWASWADALEMIHERVPQVAESVIARLHHEDSNTGCVGELRVAAAKGFSDGAGECDLLSIIRMSQASGHMDGNTTRPLLPNSSFVRP